MTFLQAIQEANSETDIKTLSLADIKEFQAFLDSFQFQQFPVNVVLPFDYNGTVLNGITKITVPLQGWVLTRLSEEPVDLRSLRAEKEYIQPMRRLAKQFIVSLLDTDVIDPEEDEVTYSIRPAYLFLDQQLFGVSYTCNIPIVESVC